MTIERALQLRESYKNIDAAKWDIVSQITATWASDGVIMSSYDFGISKATVHFIKDTGGIDSFAEVVAEVFGKLLQTTTSVDASRLRINIRILEGVTEDYPLDLVVKICDDDDL